MKSSYENWKVSLHVSLALQNENLQKSRKVHFFAYFCPFGCILYILYSDNLNTDNELMMH